MLNGPVVHSITRSVSHTPFPPPVTTAAVPGTHPRSPSAGLPPYRSPSLAPSLRRTVGRRCTAPPPSATGRGNKRAQWCASGVCMEWNGGGGVCYCAFQMCVFCYTNNVALLKYSIVHTDVGCAWGFICNHSHRPVLLWYQGDDSRDCSLLSFSYGYYLCLCVCSLVYSCSAVFDISVLRHKVDHICVIACYSVCVWEGVSSSINSASCHYLASSV